MRITKSLQEKIEGIFKSLEFKVRYEKGTFRSGYCILEDQRVIVINKFFPLEAKVNTLIEILRTVQPDVEKLDSSQRKLLEKLSQTELEI